MKDNEYIKFLENRLQNLEYEVHELRITLRIIIFTYFVAQRCLTLRAEYRLGILMPEGYIAFRTVAGNHGRPPG